MTNFDYFVTGLENESAQLEKNLRSFKYEGEEISMRTRAETLKEIATSLRKVFDIYCRYLILKRDRFLDECQVKKYCDPRNCTCKEPITIIEAKKEM